MTFFSHTIFRGCRGLAKSPRRKDEDIEPQSIIASAYRHEYIYNTYLAKNTFQLPSGTDSVYLANPSMNELMRAIQSGSSMDTFKRVIVSMIVPIPRTSQLLAQANSPCYQNLRLTPNVVHRSHSSISRKWECQFNDCRECTRRAICCSPGGRFVMR